jgi:enterochelin esterase-like enzyme
VSRTLADGGAGAVRGLARQHRGPIIEPTGDPERFDVTFVFADRRRAVTRVGLFCPAVPGGFARLGPLGDGTFAGTFPLPGGARVKYHFCPDPPDRVGGEELFRLAHSPVARRIDYFNPRVDQVRIRSLRLRLLESLLALPGAPAGPPRPLPPDTPRGDVEEFTLDSTALGHPRQVSLYRPPGPAGTDRPVVLLLESNQEWGGPEIFDSLLATGRIRPFTGVLLSGDAHLTARLRDLNGGPALARFVTAELLPRISSGRAPARDGLTVAGFSAAGLAAAALCADRPDRFSRLLAISPALHLTSRMEVLRPGAGAPPLLARYEQAAAPPRHAYLAAGRYEETPWQPVHSHTAALADLLRRRGATVRLDSGLTDHDTVSARAYLAAGLSWLLGPA